jgi:hypothetical protein
MASPTTTTTGARRSLTGYAGILTLLLLALWLGGVGNAWVAVSTLERALVSLRGRGSDRRSVTLLAGRPRRERAASPTRLLSRPVAWLRRRPAGVSREPVPGAALFVGRWTPSILGCRSS